jgi:hypothetical protein
MKMTIQEVIDKLDDISRAKDAIDNAVDMLGPGDRTALYEVKDILSEYAARILISKVEI